MLKALQATTLPAQKGSSVYGSPWMCVYEYLYVGLCANYWVHTLCIWQKQMCLQWDRLCCVHLFDNWHVSVRLHVSYSVCKCVCVYVFQYLIGYQCGNGGGLHQCDRGLPACGQCVRCVCVGVCVCVCAVCHVWLHPCLVAVSVSGPLTRAVGGLLDWVADPGGVPAAVELHRAPLESHLPAALAEAGVRVDVVVVDAGRGTLAVAGHDVDLGEGQHARHNSCCGVRKHIIVFVGLKRHRRVVRGNPAVCKQGDT